jgi:TorA maturation chaperone TorD
MIPEIPSMPGGAEGREVRAQSEIFGFLAEVLSSRPTDRALSALGAMAAELGIPCTSDLPLSEVDREYIELFVLPGPRYVAPYESVFRDEWPLPAVLQRGSNPSETGSTIKGLLMGESTIKVRDWYFRAGLSPEKDLPDHVANELRFLAWISARRAVAGPEEARFLLEFEEKFCRDHLLKWIGQLRERVAERDRSGYYHTAARMAECLAQEYAEQPEEVSGPGVFAVRSAQMGGDERERGVTGQCGRFSEQLSADLGGVQRTGCPMSRIGRSS